MHTLIRSLTVTTLGGLATRFVPGVIRAHFITERPADEQMPGAAPSALRAC
jgi:hypothetical protein